MTKTLYIGNLPWRTTKEELAHAFAERGMNVVSARIITERETGRSRGFGFVEIETEDVAAAIQSVGGMEIGGRTLTIKEALPRGARRQ